MANEQVLRALLRFSFDKRTATQVRRGITSIEDVMSDLEDQIDQSQRSLDRLVKGTQLFGVVGQELSGIGRAISDPLRQAALGYIQQAGRAEETSRQWLNATEDLERAQFRVGRAAAEAVLPVLEKAAEVASKASEFVRDHPGVVKAAMTVGTAVATLGAVGTAVSRGIKLYADVKMATMEAKRFLAATIMGRAADKQLAAAGAMQGAAGTGRTGAALGQVGKVLGAVTIAATAVYVTGKLTEEIGESIYGAKEWKDYRKDQSWILQGLGQIPKILGGAVATAGTMGAIVQASVGMDEQALTSSRNVGALAVKLFDFGETISGVGKGVEDTAKDVNKVTDELDDFRPSMGEALEMFINFQTERSEVEIQNERERTMAIEQFGRERIKMIEAEEFQRTRTIRDFHRQETQETADFQRDRIKRVSELSRETIEAEKEYYEDRLKRAEEYSQETFQFEEDYQRQRRRSQEDHRDQMEDLIAKRDAIGILQQIRESEKERRHSEEDHSVEAARRDKDFARDLRSMEEQFKRQQQIRQDDFNRQLAEGDEAFSQRRQQSRHHHDLMLADMAEDFQREMIQADEQQRYDLKRNDDLFQEEMSRRESGFSDQIRQLDVSLLGEKNLRDEYYELMAGDLEKWLKKTRQSLLPGYRSSLQSSHTEERKHERQLGGYVNSGEYRLHSGEFVLTAETTRALERLAGSSLNQQRVVQMTRGGSTFVVDQRQWSIGPGVSPKDIALIRQVSEKAAYSAFVRVTRGY